MFARMLRSSLIACVIFIPLVGNVSAQTPPASQNARELLAPAELEALVAPIALYPDALLAEVLMASTYPLEVVQAERWWNENKSLQGDQQKAALDRQKWDDSVKALVATPAALTMMSSKVDWTQKLGDAVLAQQQDVMDAVQRLRSKAQANNKLNTTKEQTVKVVQQDDKQYIAIEPTDPEMVYVPYYDPSVVYGAWSDPTYPPYYFEPPPYLGYGLLATGVAFGAGYAIGRWVSNGNLWGGGFNWRGGNLISNRPVSINRIGNNWQHNPAHRGGVRYSNATVQQRFGNNSAANRAQNRADSRGRNGQQGLNRDGNRAGAANRANSGQGQANRGNAGNKSARNNAARNNNARNNARTASHGTGSRGGNARTANVQRGRGNVGAGARPATRAAVGGGGGNFGGARGSFGGGGRGGGGFRGGGGGRGGGGRRSDLRLKQDIALLGHLDNGLGLYRFNYIGNKKSYVGLMAQEVLTVRPEAVQTGRDGYLRVDYRKPGVSFQSYDNWLASGARIPASATH